MSEMFQWHEQGRLKVYSAEVAKHLAEKVRYIPDEMSFLKLLERISQENPFKAPFQDVSPRELKKLLAYSIGVCMRGGFDTIGSVRQVDALILQAIVNNKRGKGANLLPNGRAEFVKAIFEGQNHS